jgi:hypothetical protein
MPDGTWINVSFQTPLIFRYNLPLRDFASGIYLSETQNPITPPPLHTVCIRVYCILYTFSHGEGWEGARVKPERRLEWQQFTKLGQNYQHDWLYLQSVNSVKHLQQSSFTGKFF